MIIVDKWRQLPLWGLLAVATLTLSNCGTDNRGEKSVLITGALVYDGQGGVPQELDVLVRGGRIAEVSSSISTTAQIEIDGTGLILTPGFIDLHAHGDPITGGSTDSRYFENFLRQGVTTICLGMDGFSDDRLLGWLDQLDSIPLDVNIVPFVGHSTLRQLSGIGHEENPSPASLQTLDSLLQVGLDHGYAGLSTGLEYLPGGLAEVAELEVLARTTGRYDRMIMSHLRNEDDDKIDDALQELVSLGQFCRVHVSHLKVVYGKGKSRGEEILGNLRTNSTVATADLYPYLASYTGIGILFPEWAKPPNDFEQVRVARRAELEGYLHERVMLRNGPDATLLGTAPYTGLTLAEAADQMNMSFVNFLIDEMGPQGGSGAYFIMDQELQGRLMQDTLVSIASDGSPTMNHPRGYGTFAKVLSGAEAKESALTLEEAIRKMTSLPASILRLKDRGVIKEGYVADIALIDVSELRDVATYQKPHQLAEGVEWVLINGEVVVGDSVFRQAGELLRFN